MCGRTYYSVNAVASAAATIFGMNETTAMLTEDSNCSGCSSKPNTGPGNEFLIFRRCQSISACSLSSSPVKMENAQANARVDANNNNSSSNSSNTDHQVEIVKAIWGLLPTAGTHQSPHYHPSDTSNFSYSSHYKMFNARIETIHTKKSFINLICNQQTCILVVEGYYEWITNNLDDDNRSRQSKEKKKQKKQPYFVCTKDYNNNRQLEQQCRRSSKPLLLAGLWSTVNTGRKQQQVKRRHDDDNVDNVDDYKEEEDETIITFTILTTNANPKYNWLHPRQPIMLWDASIVNEWLFAPTVDTVNKLHSVPIHGSIDDDGMKSMWDTGELVVYPVSDKMNTLSYQGTDCNVEIKLGCSSSRNKYGIKSYFTSQKQQQQQQQQPTGEGPIMKRAKVEVADSTIKDEWACTKCTYVHSGDRMSTYLVCVICGAERGDS